MKTVNLTMVVEQGEKTINYIFGGKTTVEDMLEVIDEDFPNAAIGDIKALSFERGDNQKQVRKVINRWLDDVHTQLMKKEVKK